jgi:16S rRNA C967 or C1407 C5-methylase (RsmB/RsmF family)
MRIDSSSSSICVIYTTHRVNTLKTGREAVIKELGKRGVKATPTRYSPWGVTIEDTQDVRVFDQDIYRLG